MKTKIKLLGLSVALSVLLIVLGTQTTLFKGSLNGMPGRLSRTSVSASNLFASGVCIVKDFGTEAPFLDDPDVGFGYTKIEKTGVNTLEGLTTRCDEDDYEILTTLYCLNNDEPYQKAILTFNGDGSPAGGACSGFGCGYEKCADIDYESLDLEDFYYPETDEEEDVVNWDSDEE